MFAESSSRPNVKGIKKNGTQDKRCNAKTIKITASQFSLAISDHALRAPNVAQNLAIWHLLTWHLGAAMSGRKPLASLRELACFRYRTR
jgi:hypothetical protein